MTILTQGIVLRRQPWHDYDRQYVIYTKEVGKVWAIAKSTSKIVSKLSSHLELFFLVDLMLASGRSGWRIAGAKSKKNYSAIYHDLTKLIMASYFLEAVDNLMQYDYHDEKIFSILDEFLSQLSENKEDRYNFLILNKSLFDLLSHQGYGPLIKAKSQKQLTAHLHKAVLAIGERQINSFGLLQKIIQ